MRQKTMRIAAVIVLAAAALAVLGRWEAAPSAGSTDGLVGADMARVAVAAALVMPMTPVLGFLYGGLVRHKNLLSTIVQCLIIFALVTGVWTLWGYSPAFAPAIGGVVGDLRHVLLRGVGTAPDPEYSTTIPSLPLYFRQLRFAAITPALIIGAFAERIRFRSLLVFLVIWAMVVYAPAAHWVWGDGCGIRGRWTSRAARWCISPRAPRPSSRRWSSAAGPPMVRRTGRAVCRM